MKWIEWNQKVVSWSLLEQCLAGGLHQMKCSSDEPSVHCWFVIRWNRETALIVLLSVNFWNCPFFANLLSFSLYESIFYFLFNYIFLLKFDSFLSIFPICVFSQKTALFVMSHCFSCGGVSSSVTGSWSWGGPGVWEHLLYRYGWKGGQWWPLCFKWKCLNRLLF